MKRLIGQNLTVFLTLDISRFISQASGLPARERTLLNSITHLVGLPGCVALGVLKG